MASPRQMDTAIVDHLTATKRAERSRYLDSVTDWEHREYFDVF